MYNENKVLQAPPPQTSIFQPPIFCMQIKFYKEILPFHPIYYIWIKLPANKVLQGVRAGVRGKAGLRVREKSGRETGLGAKGRGLGKDQGKGFRV